MLRRSVVTLLRLIDPVACQPSLPCLSVASCSHTLDSRLEPTRGNAGYASRSNPPSSSPSTSSSTSSRNSRRGDDDASPRRRGTHLGAHGRPEAIDDALAAASELPGGRQHAGGYGQPAALRTWQRAAGPHWRSAWDGSDSGRANEKHDRQQRRQQHEQQQQTQSIWHPDGEEQTLLDGEDDTAFPQRAGYRFVSTARMAPGGDAAEPLPLWQRPQLQRRAERLAAEAGVSTEAPPTVALTRPPIYFPDFTLEMMKLSDGQLEQVKRTGWLPEVVFKTQPHVTKLEIKGLLEAMYGLKVDRVATINYLGAKVTTMDTKGRSRLWRRDDWKKAYVRLQPPVSQEASDNAPTTAPAADAGVAETFLERVHRLRVLRPSSAGGAGQGTGAGSAGGGTARLPA